MRPLPQATSPSRFPEIPKKNRARRFLNLGQIGCVCLEAMKPEWTFWTGQAEYTARGGEHMKLARPEPGEYAPYYEKYIALVPGADATSALEAQRVRTMQLFAGRGERDGNFRYAPKKWTVKEVLGHMVDSERIFTYRALRIARADQTPIEGFEQDDYVRGGGFSE